MRFCHVFRHCLPLLVGLACMLAPPASLAQGLKVNSTPLTTTYTSEQYSGGLQNWCVDQGPQGMVYVGNNMGLLAFDGTHWNRLPVKNGTKVRSVQVGLDGRIYVGAQGEFGYFYYNQAGQLAYNSVSDQLQGGTPIGEAWNVYLVNNAVYYCTFGAIFKFENNVLQVVGPAQTLDFTFLIQNQLYTQLPGQGLAVLRQDQRFELVPGTEAFKQMSVRSILPFPNGQWLVLTHAQGAYLFDQRSNSVSPWAPAHTNLFTQGLLNCGVQLANGMVAIGTQNQGLLLLSPDGVLLKRMGRGSGLGDQTVNHLFEDLRGNLWAALHDGLTLIELGLPFSSIGRNVGISGAGYATAVFNDQLYIGTSNYVYRWSKEAPLADFVPVPGSQGQCYALQVFDQSLLVSHHNGALQLAPAGLEKLADVDGTWMLLRPRTQPNKLIAGHYGGLYLLERQQGGGRQGWRFVKQFPGFTESARVLAQDAQGHVWMTHGYKGAYKITFSPDYTQIVQVQYFNEQHGFPSNYLINVFEVDGQLLFAAETGIYVFNETSNRFAPHQAFNTLLGQGTHVREMVQDALGNIYYLANNEAGMLKKNNLGGYQKSSTIFNKIMPYMNDALEHIQVVDNDMVMFSAKNGFMVYNPSMPYQMPPPAPVLIRNFTVSTDSVRTLNHSVVHAGWQTPPQLAYGQSALKITFSSPEYGALDRTQYRVKLQGFDNDWSAWSPATAKEYTNLTEGSYTFTVQARDVYGQLSPTASVAFTVAPPWYRSKLAYGIYLMLVMGLGVLGYVAIQRRFYKEKSRLQDEQQEALKETEIKYEVLEKESTEEITRLRNEKLQSELELKSKELGSATMQILSKNEFINHLKQAINGLVKKSNNQAVKKDLQKLIKEIERNIDSYEDWEQFELHFDKVHGDFTKRIKTAYPDLTPQEMKLVAYLRMNLSTKEIAQLLNISLRGVEIARYRLRKKLQLERSNNLSEFVLGF